MGRDDPGKRAEVPPAECHGGGTAATPPGPPPTPTPLPLGERGRGEGPGDAELFDLLLQSGTLHSQAGRGPLRTAYHPAGFAEDAQDVLPFGVGQGETRGQRSE